MRRIDGRCCSSAVFFGFGPLFQDIDLIFEFSLLFTARNKVFLILSITTANMSPSQLIPILSNPNPNPPIPILSYPILSYPVATLYAYHRLCLSSAIVPYPCTHSAICTRDWGHWMRPPLFIEWRSPAKKRM